MDALERILILTLISCTFTAVYLCTLKKLINDDFFSTRLETLGKTYQSKKERHDKTILFTNDFLKT